MSASLVPERWALVGSGKDPDSGHPMVLIGREKIDFEHRVTIWKLVQWPNGWYNAGQMISTGVFRIDPKRKKGVKLSDSRIDSNLIEFATQATHTEPLL